VNGTVDFDLLASRCCIMLRADRQKCTLQQVFTLMSRKLCFFWEQQTTRGSWMMLFYDACRSAFMSVYRQVRHLSVFVFLKKLLLVYR